MKYANQDPENFYQGSTSWFRQVDLSDLGDTTALVPIEADLDLLGFEHLGDFVCSALTTSVNRAFVCRDEKVQALLQVVARDSKVQVICLFFSSMFAGDATATTTATVALKDTATDGYSRKVYKWSNAYNLFHDHKKHIEEITSRYGPVVPIDATLRAAFESIDKSTMLYG